MATNEDNTKWSLGEALLSETPYKHAVRHAVTGTSHHGFAPRRACGLSKKLLVSNPMTFIQNFVTL